MEHISLLFQVVIAVSVLIVWVFRYHNVITEFQQFGYSDVFRNFVGASKIAISTLLLIGIRYPELTPYAAMGMAAFMLAAQLSHLRVKNPFLQRLPSLVFLLMSIFVALFHFGVI
jgi:tellurite resistance protein TehA-like permease